MKLCGLSANICGLKPTPVRNLKDAYCVCQGERVKVESNDFECHLHTQFGLSVLCHFPYFKVPVKVVAVMKTTIFTFRSSKFLLLECVFTTVGVTD